MKQRHSILDWFATQDKRLRFDLPVLVLIIISTFLILEQWEIAPRLIAWIESQSANTLASIILTVALTSLYLVVFILRRQRVLLKKIHQANTDALVGLLNRRKGTEMMEQALVQANLHHVPFSVIMFDIDNFKQINDKLGHQQGDAVLKDVSALVQRLTRRSDLLIRWGGEEFMVGCRGTPHAAAELLAIRIREAIEAHNFSIAQTVTASFGVTEYALCEELDDMIKRVDTLLYESKQLGKNRVSSQVPANTVFDRRLQKSPHGAG